MWGKKQAKNPQASVIGGLQKQVAERDEEIEQLNQQITALKTRLAEGLKVLEDSEKVIDAQGKEIQELKNMLRHKGNKPGSEGKGLSTETALTGASSLTEALTAEIDALRAECEDLRADAGDEMLRNQVQNLQARLLQQQEEINTLRRENLRLTSAKDVGKKMEFLDK